MKKLLVTINNIFIMFGINLIVFMRSIRGLPSYVKDLRRYKIKSKFFTDFPIIKIWPCLSDKYSEGGEAKGHYFHQDLLVAKKIFSKNPTRHVDIGSRIDGFVAHVASFRTIDVFDIRPIKSNIENINFIQLDLMSSLDDTFINSCDSLSCLHTLEHFGLGRYGDEINSNGHIDGLKNITKILKPNGILYLSVPIGQQRVEFNAHRVFSIKYLNRILSNDYDLLSFSYVDDAGALYIDISIEEGLEDNFECMYGCGIFELKKRTNLTL